MYQYLIGGRVSEVCGTYKPIGKDAFLKEIKVYDKTTQAVIFKIKTAKNEGKIRLCTIPMNSEYEPWIKEVFKYFNDFGDECPFIFTKRGKLEYNDSYYMVKARNIFKKYKQEMDIYYDDDGKIPKRDKKFTSDAIRKLRIKSLKEDYNFTDEEIKIFTGTDKSFFIYPYGDKNISELINASEKYYKKLFIPFSELKKEKYQLILSAKNADELRKRIERAIEIGNLINVTNSIFELKTGSYFFLKDNSNIIIELFKSCNNNEEWLNRITNIALLFDINKIQLKKIVKKTNSKGTIKLIEQWLNENTKIYNLNMIETWLNIKKLRNWTPIHPRTDIKSYQKLLNFFGIKVSTQIDYYLLWEKVLDKFLISLKSWQQIVDNL